MPVNKATVDTAEETKIIKAEMNSQWKKGITVLCETFSQ